MGDYNVRNSFPLEDLPDYYQEPKKEDVNHDGVDPPPTLRRNRTEDREEDDDDDEEDDDDDDDDESSEEAKPEEPSMMRMVIHQCLTNGGLIVLLICYTCMGAAVFQHLEAPLEKREAKQLQRHLQQQRILFLRTVKSFSDLAETDEEAWRNLTEASLETYENELGVTVVETEFVTSWNFYGSMFFATTVLTTIGYGNIAPVTVGGRVFCMVYAVFGIALLLLVLASIGTLLARGATLGYRRIRNRCKKKANKDEPDVVTFQRDRRSQEIMDDTWRSTGGEKGGGGGEGDDDSHVVDLHGDKKNGESSGASQKRHSKGDKLEEAIEPVKLDDAQIPISFVLVFAFVYICFLALLLHTWEEQWDYFEAFYFSFITLTTIGFGDLVPLHQKNLLACTFFILLGMAIMSMCIALAQEMIIKKVAWLSKKIGVAFASHRKRPSDESES